MAKLKIELIYEDSEILVINKPCGVSVTKDRSGKRDLMEELTGQLGEKAGGELRLVHRLDKHTSGVMILGKNVEAQSKFSSYFAKRLIKKTYLAIVSGVVGGGRGVIKTRLAPSRKNSSVMCVSGRGKEAITEWKVLADFGLVALLAVYPVTERTHQVRVHLGSAGLDLIIDLVYGGKRGLYLSDFKRGYRLGKGEKERPLLDRLSLHAYQLEVGSSNGRKVFIAGLDKKFSAAIKMLAKHNPNGFEAFVDADDFFRIMNSERLV